MKTLYHHYLWLSEEDELQVYLDQNYYRKEEIDKKIKGASTDGFATWLQGVGDSRVVPSGGFAGTGGGSREPLPGLRGSLRCVPFSEGRL